MSRLAFDLFERYVRYVRDNVFSTTPDPLSEYSDAEQRRQAMVHSFEILQARDGGFDKAAFLEKALDMITSIWTAAGTGNLASVGSMLTPWCSRQWEQGAPRFVPSQPPSLTTEQLSLDQAIPGDDVDLVEVRVRTSEGRPPQGFPVVWAFARPRSLGDGTDWRLESMRLCEQS